MAAVWLLSAYPMVFATTSIPRRMPLRRNRARAGCRYRRLLGHLAQHGLGLADILLWSLDRVRRKHEHHDKKGYFFYQVFVDPLRQSDLRLKGLRASKRGAFFFALNWWGGAHAWNHFCGWFCCVMPLGSGRFSDPSFRCRSFVCCSCVQQRENSVRGLFWFSEQFSIH